MVHRQICVGLRPQTRDKRAVGRHRSKDIQPFTAEHLANGCNDCLIFRTQMAALTGVRV